MAEANLVRGNEDGVKRPKDILQQLDMACSDDVVEPVSSKSTVTDINTTQEILIRKIGGFGAVVGEISTSASFRPSLT